MKLVFHGAAREVGRSCIEVVMSGKRLLLDCGLKLTPEGSEYPAGFANVDDIKAVFISHAHLDHTGALPWLDHNGMDCPIFMTKTTRYLTRLILKDAFKIGKIGHQHLGYDDVDLKKVLNCISKVNIDEKGRFGDIEYEFFDAGHIPGAAAIMLKSEGQTLLYTGDINTNDSLLLHGSEPLPQADILICESTYGAKDHPDRQKEEKSFIEAVSATIKEGGSVLIPVFAIGRAQEVILMLSRYKWKVPIYFSGMGVEATDIILSEPEDITDSEELYSALKKVKIARTDIERAKAMKQQCIIVTTSGMLTGGPVMDYLKHIFNNPSNSVLITGYQADNTNGRMLLEKKEVYLDGFKKSVKCKVVQFDFSAHAGASQIKSIVRQVKPKKVYFVHGEEESVIALCEWASALGFEARAPVVGQVIDTLNKDD